MQFRGLFRRKKLKVELNLQVPVVEKRSLLIKHFGSMLDKQAAISDASKNVLKT